MEVKEALPEISGRDFEFLNDLFYSSPTPPDVVKIQPKDHPVDVKEVRPKAKRRRTCTPAVVEEAPPKAKRRRTGTRFVPFDDAVQIWFENYERDPRAAIVGLLSSLFKECGVPHIIGEQPSTVVPVFEAYGDSEMKNDNSLEENLVYSWRVEFDTCAQLMSVPGYTCYVIDLSCDPARVFGRFASLVGLQLAQMLNSKLVGTTTQALVNCEMKLSEMLSTISAGLFERYENQDSCSNTRMYWMQTLGVWVRSYPSISMLKLYLTCFHRVLNDKSVDVKKASLGALHGLFRADGCEPYIRECEPYLRAFASSLISLVGADDMDVAENAVGVVAELLRYQLLTKEDSLDFYKNLTDKRPEIRRAMGKVVYDLVIVPSLPDSKEDSLEAIRIMLKILRKTPPVLIDFVVEGVWWHMEAMQDWRRIISLLMEPQQQFKLEETDTTLLIHLLFISVRKAVGSRIFVCWKKQPVTKKEEANFKKKKKEMTSVMMMNAYPNLVRKFKDDKKNVIPLVEIIWYMDRNKLDSSEHYTKEMLLGALMDAFLTHGDDKDTFFKRELEDPLSACVTAIRFLATGRKGKLRPDVAKRLGDGLVANLESAMNKAAVAEHKGDRYPLLVNLKRMFELDRTFADSKDLIYPRFEKVLLDSTGLIKPRTIRKIVKAGFRFAVRDPPRRLSFMTCGLECIVIQLPWDQADAMFKYIRKKTEDVVDKETPEWGPYYEIFHQLWAKMHFGSAMDYIENRMLQNDTDTLM